VSRIPPFLRGLAIIGAIALVVVVLNLETALSTAALLARVAFFLAVAFVAYLLWRDVGRREIGLWPARQQWVFYGAVGLLVADLGWWFLGTLSGVDLFVFFVVAAVSIAVAVRTWRERHTYS
jgi:hypothetical protein